MNTYAPRQPGSPASLSRWLLTPAALVHAEARYRYARAYREMGPVSARLYVALALLALLFLRLESPSWSALRLAWRPWFSRITERPHRIGNPLRYLVQTAWLSLVQPGPALHHAWPIKQIGQFFGALGRIRSRFFAWLASIPAAVSTSPGAQQLAQRYHHAGHVGRRLILALVALISAALLALLITQPFTLGAQAVFVVLLWGVALVVRRIPSHFSLLILMVLSVTVSARYIWWRYTSTLNLDHPLDAFFGLGLLFAETYSWIVLLLGYLQTALPLRRPPAALPGDTSLWPTVDLMIPTYNEDLAVVKPTVYAALGMDWPRDKLRIHLLDDGKREAFRAFAAEVGINYIVRPDNKHAKAGNLNHALQFTDGDLIAIFDCDHIPTRSFLQMTVGWFLRDPDMALVQTPHHFFSPDPFERNLGHFRQHPSENILFYGLVQDGNDLWNASFFCGSCAVLRRSALTSIGGFAVQTVTEDAHTALRLHRKGYNSAYVRIPQAAGLATESLSAHIGQRIRWARGMVQIFRTDNPLLGRGLTLFQRLCYTNAMLHFLAGVPRIIYLTAPLAFLLVHSYILYAPALAIVLYVLPHMAHSVLTNSRLQGSYRRTFWGEIYETVLAWYIARPTTVALFAPSKGKFNVTAKGGLIEEQYFDSSISHPYVLLALANIAGFCFGIWRLVAGPADEVLAVIVTMAWVLYNLIILGGAISVAAETRQVRKTHRVPTRLPATVQSSGGHSYPAVLSDFSEGGAGITLHGNHVLRQNEQVRLILARGDRHYSFPARISRNMGDNLGLKFELTSTQQHIDLVQCTFARADSWLVGQHDFAPDQPMYSLYGILLTGFRGYKHLARHLPFPLNRLLSLATATLEWLSSFLPRVRRPASLQTPISAPRDAHA